MYDWGYSMFDLILSWFFPTSHIFGPFWGYFRHTDNSSGNGRLLTALVYLNENWQQGDGGELRLFYPGAAGHPHSARMACLEFRKGFLNLFDVSLLVRVVRQGELFVLLLCSLRLSAVCFFSTASVRREESEGQRGCTSVSGPPKSCTHPMRFAYGYLMLPFGTLT
jgi:hypothetical protein